MISGETPMLRRIAVAVIASAAVCAAALVSPRVRAAAPPTSYRWFAELSASDPATKTVTVKIKIPDHVTKYLDRFKAGDQIVLVWDMIPPRPAAPPAPAPEAAAAPKPEDAAKDGEAKPAAPQGRRGAPPAAPPPPPVVLKTESDVLLFIDTAQASKAAHIDTGYILPAQFVSGDAAGKTVTVKLKVSDEALKGFGAVQSGRRFRATS